MGRKRETEKKEKRGEEDRRTESEKYVYRQTDGQADRLTEREKGERGAMVARSETRAVILKTRLKKESRAGADRSEKGPKTGSGTRGRRRKKRQVE